MNVITTISDNMDLHFAIGPEEFVSKKATNKLVQQTKVSGSN